jgi:predicted ATPase/class 3 adenylate cyclase
MLSGPPDGPDVCVVDYEVAVVMSTPFTPRLMALLFTDVADSVAIKTRLGDEEFIRLLEQHNALFDSVLSSIAGAEQIKGTGDGFLARFPSASAAIEAALSFQWVLAHQSWGSEPLVVRVGVHVGEACDVAGHHGLPDVAGLAVDLAARVMGLAMPGQVLLTRAVLDAAQPFVRQPPAVDAAAHPNRPALRWVNHGLYLLKGHGEPLEIFEVGAEGVAPLERPPDSEKAHRFAPNNLPRHKERTSFVGRAGELAALKQLLKETCLLTLTGSGGCGKTRLALRLARDLMDEFPEGVWFVELASVADPGLVAEQVRNTLDLKVQPGKAVAQALADHLRGKAALLILDNCEHLLQACADLAHDLLGECPSLKVLATSQQRLDVPGEVPHRVPSLSLPVRGRSPGASDLKGSEAVSLFVERAQSLNPDFKLNETTAPAVAEICRRVDGIPLALELAAACVRVISLNQIVGRLDEMFHILTEGGRTVLARHQTLRATIQWSYDLLNPDEKLLLQRLGAFVGGWTLETAENVCSDGPEIVAPSSAAPAAGAIRESDVFRLLRSLFERSLVAAKETADGQRRYWLLESVRQFAQEESSRSGGAAAVRDRHLDFFLALAEEAEAKLNGQEQKAWLERLDAEHNNLQAAMRWCRAHSGAEYAQKNLRLASHLWSFWDVHGHFAVGRAALAEALGRPDARAPTEARAKALNCAAYLAFQQRDYAQANSLAGQSLEIRRAQNNRKMAARSLMTLGKVACDLGDYETAQKSFQESWEIHHELGVLEWEAGNLVNLTEVALLMGEYEKAKTLALSARKMNRQVGKQEWEALSIDFQTRAVRELGDQVEARVLQRESLRVKQRIGDKLGIAASLALVGGLAAAAAEAEKAVRFLGAGERLREELGSPPRHSERVRYDHDVSAARAALDEATFVRAWSEGRAVSWDRALAEALDWLDRFSE